MPSPSTTAAWPTPTRATTTAPSPISARRSSSIRITLSPTTIAALAYAAKRDYDRAIADYDKAIELDPANALAYNNRGRAYADKGDHDRAIADYDKAIQLDPKFAQRLQRRGNAYFAKGDYDRAIADYDEAIKLDPKYAFAYHNRALAYREQGRLRPRHRRLRRGDQARSEIHLGVQQPRLRLLRQGDYDRAIADYDEAIKLNPKFALAYNNRGNALFGYGRS